MKKRVFRATWIQQLMATLFAAWLRVCYATLRWEREGQEKVESVWARHTGQPGGGAILCFWHARIPLAPLSWPQATDHQDMRALISMSADGEFITQAMGRIGFPAIRGSSKKNTAPGKNKHGEAAFREMIKWVKDGGAVAITPDGPRGPAEHMEPGTISLARVTGAPVMLVGLASKPCIRIGSWDRTLIPLPFSKGAMVWDGPLQARREDDPEALRSDWEARLSAATARAEAMLER